GEPSQATLFQVGGTGARAVKDGLSATGFPSGVAGVPAEVLETLAPLIQHRRQLRTDSGGAGQYRGGLGQATEVSYRGGGPWRGGLCATGGPRRAWCGRRKRM